MNISGILVNANPARLGEVKEALLALPGVEIPVGSDDGRLVVVIDEPGGIPSGKALMEIQNVPGVLSANLVYHHQEEDETEVVENNIKPEEKSDADHTA